ncbi:MAG: 2-dehydropantoate 2-reductase [Anaerolineales bacterium]
MAGIPDERILICGTGALASLFAVRLGQAGVQVTMTGRWAAALDVIAAQGVTLHPPDSPPIQTRPQVARQPQAARGIPWALVLRKSWQTAETASWLAACLPPEGLALSLQNGLGNLETLQAALGESRAAAGVTTLPAALTAPGVVRQTGQGDILLGAHPRLSPLADLLRRAGFTVHVHADLRGVQWGKLVVNAAINPLGALLGLPNGALLQDPEARRTLHALAREAAAVAAAQGIRLPYPDPLAAVEAVARRTAGNENSMLQDLRRGAPTELEAITGAVLRIAKKHGLEIPVTVRVYRALQQTLAERHPTSDIRHPTPDTCHS